MSLSPKVLVNSIPKSGTHLLLQIILGIPGMIITPSWIIEDEDLALIMPGSVGPGHLIHSAERTQLLKQKNTKGHFYHKRPKRHCRITRSFCYVKQMGQPPLDPLFIEIRKS